MIYAELRKILRSKFVFVASAIILAAGFAIPFITKQDDSSRESSSESLYKESININGQTVYSDSPFFRTIEELSEQKKSLEALAATKSDDFALGLVDTVLEGTLESAEYVSSTSDYRYFISMQKRDALAQGYILRNSDVCTAADIVKAMDCINWGIDEKSVRAIYLDLDDKTKEERLADIDAQLEMTYQVETKNDYKAYYTAEIARIERGISKNELEIEALEKEILDNPAQEDELNKKIDSYRNNIKREEQIDIYILEYRIENEIYPYFTDWRDSAASDKQNAMHDLWRVKMISREEFEKDTTLRNTYKRYSAYKTMAEGVINTASKRLHKANMSLESGKPDMEYVLDGVRSRTTNFLWYSLVISLFAAMLGGGLMSKEFSDGTIRLLLIRPKTRVKIMLSRLAALLIICFVLLFASAALNILANGIVYGFADFTYPNYSISAGTSGVNFFADYSVKLFMCFFAVAFVAVLSYSMSAVTGNTALSVAVPIVVIFASLAFILFFLDGSVNPRSLRWVFNTPLPYVNMFIYYVSTGYWYDTDINDKMGALLITGLSIAVAFAGAVKFKNCDIRN